MKYFRGNNMVTVWTPTYSSWLNVIEPHFGAMKKYALDCSDDRDHQTRRRRIYNYIRRRNRNAGAGQCRLAKVFNH